jgi:serine/threonine protein kinase/tetratricopeptide (TPR) repeat protein
MISAPRVCPQCGAEIPSDAPEGGCPCCLLHFGLLPDARDASTITATEANDGGSGENVEVNAGAAAGHSEKPARSAEKLGELGDYELLEVVGRGGQGVVYRAHQKSLNRTVALKMISLGSWATEAHLKRFRREAEAAASLEHPGIVPIYEVGERDGSCYFSMRFVEGGQLDQVIKRQPMSIRQAAELIAKVARTVHYAHEHGILHRDIKPGNILLDAKAEPLLTDFGLARLVEAESTVTRTKEVMGTPSYMAPEQAVGNNAAVSSATDVYGLGAVLYQLLTGHPPFAGGTTYETIKLVLDTEPRQPRQLNPKIDRELSTICLKCLEKDPKRRYSSALALAEDLEHWLKHEPIRAKPSGLFTHSRKWVRRNPSTAGLIALLVALAAGSGVVVWNRVFAVPMPKSVAVLPFENLSDDSDNAHFAEGIQEEILTRLAKIADLKVISRTSTKRYQSKPGDLDEIAKQLGVANIVEGSVQKIGDAVHITVQLIRAATDEHIWAESYNRKLDDVFGVEGEVATAIADQLNAKLTGAEQKAVTQKPTDNLAAYDAYLRALSIEHQRYGYAAYREAAAQYATAVQLDPKFALAWARLGVLQSFLYFNGVDTKANLPEAVKQAADTALALQPDLAEAWIAQGAYRYRVLRDFAGALHAYDEGRKRAPNNAFVYQYMAYVERRLGRWNDAVEHYRKSAELDPQDLQLFISYGGECLNLLRRFDEAQAALDRALQISPGDEGALANKANVFQSQGRLAEAAATLKRIPPDSTDNYVILIRTWQASFERRFDDAIAVIQRKLATISPTGALTTADKALLMLLSYCYEWAGKPNESRDAFQRALQAFKPSSNSVAAPDALGAPEFLALTYAGLGEKEKALAQAKQAVAEYNGDAVNQPAAEATLAQIQARLGDLDSAIAAIPHLLEVPAGITIADLRLNPLWDPLRSDPAFRKLCEEKQP